MHEKKKRKKGGGIAGNFKEVYLYNAPLFLTRRENAPFEEEPCIEMTSPRQSAVNTVDISR